MAGTKSPITCHVLDASLGKPASGVKVALHCLRSTAQEDGSRAIAEGETDGDGRCSTLLDPAEGLPVGKYKMIFFTGPYFEARQVETFYPLVEITFAYTNPSQHYHIPLLLSPFSYTTYRGS